MFKALFENLTILVVNQYMPFTTTFAKEYTELSLDLLKSLYQQFLITFLKWFEYIHLYVIHGLITVHL